MAGGRMTLRGRAGEMNVLLGALRTATRTGQGVVVALAGEPGIGKTSLLRDAAEQARRRGFAVGTGKTEEIDQIAPGAPLLTALRYGARPLLDAASFAGLEPLYERPLWLVDRIAELLEEAAARQPVLIALDDVQWADPLTRFALRLLPSRLAGSPVVWLLSSRLAPIETLDEVLATADPAVTVDRLTLGPIDGDAIDELAADVLGEIPDAATRRLLGGVGGSPFWALQLLTALARGLPEAEAHAELIPGIRRRIAMLPEAVAPVVHIVAVCGRPMPAATVAELLDLLGSADTTTSPDTTTTDVVYEAARHARDEGLLAIEPAGISLPHDVIREAVYAHIPPAERRRLHRARGRQLVAEDATALTAAPHFLAGAEADDLEAAEVVLRAAAESIPLVPEQAARLARAAFALFTLTDPRALEIGERALTVLMDAQRGGDVLELADALLPLATTPEAVARIEVTAGRALWEMSACEQLELRAGAALTRPGLPPVARARLMALRALAATRTRSAPDAAAAAAVALSEGTHLADVFTRRTALHALTEAHRNIGEHRKVLDYFDQLREVSPGTHLAERVRALQHLDRYTDAADLLTKARQDAGGDLDRMLPSLLYAQAWQHHNLGDLEAADVTARTLLREAEATTNLAYALNARMILCAIEIYRGQLPEARAWMSPLEDKASGEDPLRVSRLRLMQAWLAGVEGDLERALTVVRPLLFEAEDGYHLWAWSPAWMRTFGGIAHHAGDTATAAQALRLADLGARRNPGVSSLQGVALQLKGFMYADADTLSAAVATMRDSPRPLLLAGALRDLGDVLGAAGDGLSALTEAHDIYAAAGAWGYAARPGAARRRRRSTHGWDALTESETRVAELIGSGHTNRSAATKLGISPNTVGTHLRSIFAKLDVRSRVQLANVLNSAIDRPAGR